MNTQDMHGRECAIYVERTPESRSISVGDAVTWAGAFALWTPKNRAFEDRRIRRMSGSGVARPDATSNAR